MNTDIVEIERRLSNMETSHKSLEAAFKVSDQKLQTLTDSFDLFKEDVNGKLDTITAFVSGANTVFGLARKHWKTVIVFGAGAMTSLGMGNPAFNAFVTQFFGA